MLTETLKALEEHAAQYKQYKHMAEEAEKLANEHRDAIKKLLNGESGPVYTGDYKITCTTYDRTTLDTKSLQREMPGIYAMYRRTLPTEKLTIN